LQQISQSVPPSKKPSPHQTRKKKKKTEKQERRRRRQKTKKEKRTRKKNRKKNKKEETTPRRTKKKEQERSQQKKFKKEAQHKNQITVSDENFIQRKGKRPLIHKFYSKKADPISQPTLPELKKFAGLHSSIQARKRYSKKPHF
jgi:hypothetical protein